MYENVKATITYNYGKRLTEYFVSACGVKQGCTLSLVLFSLFINELVAYLDGKFVDGIFISEHMLNFIALLLADDMVLAADSVIILLTS